MKLVIGFITFGENTAKYLPYFLPSLFDEDLDFKVLVVDNTPESSNKNLSYLKKHYPQIEIVSQGENLGFARGYNLMIKRARELGADYFCALNPDMLLEKGALKNLVEVLENDHNLGSASPLVLRWDFKENKKTQTIDTCGIRLLPGLRFIDSGQGEKVSGFKECRILAPSGAAGIYRIFALERVKQEDEYFEEMMFMYKEDCDLGYRLFLAGYESKCIPESIIYHDRTVYSRGQSDYQVALNRKNKSKQVKKWSMRGQQIIFFKFWPLQNWKEKLFIIWLEIKMIVFALIFESYLLKEVFKVLGERKKIKTPPISSPGKGED